MNHSGSAIRNKDVEIKEINIEPMMNNKEYYNKEESHDDREINRVLNSFERMRNEDPELFQEILLLNKGIMEICSKDKSSREDIKLLEDNYADLEEINEDFLFWCSHKSITKAALEHKNVDISHFMIVKKGYKLYNKRIHKHLLHDYFKSLSHLNFMECDEEEMSKYRAIFEFMVSYGKADINETDDNLGNTPLHFAILFKQIQFIVFLIGQPNIKLNTRNKFDDTPLDFAIESFRRGEDSSIYAEVIKLLLETGAEAYSQRDYFQNEEDKN